MLQGNSGSAQNPYDEEATVLAARARAVLLGAAVHVLKHIGGLQAGRYLPAGNFFRWKDTGDEQGRLFSIPSYYAVIQTVYPDDPLPSTVADDPSPPETETPVDLDPAEEVRNLMHRLEKAGVDASVIRALDDVAQIAAALTKEQSDGRDADDTAGETTGDHVDLPGPDDRQR